MTALERYVAGLEASLRKALAIATTINDFTRGEDLDYIEQLLEEAQQELQPIKGWALATGRYKGEG